MALNCSVLAVLDSWDMREGLERDSILRKVTTIVEENNAFDHERMERLKDKKK